MEDVHIGSLIKQKVEERGISVSELARRLKCTRPNVYNIFEREAIDTRLLQQISEALSHNFFENFGREKEPS